MHMILYADHTINLQQKPRTYAVTLRSAYGTFPVNLKLFFFLDLNELVGSPYSHNLILCIDDLVALWV